LMEAAMEATLGRLGVHPLIRCRPGDFLYSAVELRTMAREIRFLLAEGAHGVVIGALGPGGTVDLDATRFLADAAREVDGAAQLTFHRAIDQTPDPVSAVGKLVDLGFTRLLTSGGGQTAGAGVEVLQRMAKEAWGPVTASIPPLTWSRTGNLSGRRGSASEGIMNEADSSLTVTTVTLDMAELGPESPLPVLSGELDQPYRIGDGVPEELRAAAAYGRVPNVFPYRMQDAYSRDRTPHEVPAVVLENSNLRAVVLPGLGGRVWELQDKRTGKQLLHTHGTLQFANIALRKAWFAGGLEWNIGTRGHSPTT